MKTIAVIHYLPLEYYPPATNFLRFIADNLKPHQRVYAFSTFNVKGRHPFEDPRILVTRFPFPIHTNLPYWRLFKYALFNIGTLISLLRRQPDVLIYYESYSAWPAYWYMRLRRKQTKLFIHYHEYFPPEWYANGMRTVKNYYEKEKSFLWKQAVWISHTNGERLSLFKEDHPFINEKKLQVMPNYPPKRWQQYRKKINENSYSQTIKTIYVGSLSLSNTYIKEYCEWVMLQKGKVTFTIYSYNLHDSTVHYLNSLESEYIHFVNEGVEYEQLPLLLPNFHVGLILYRGITANHRFNAPNKLFEYLACGLDVWYPLEMEGMKPYQSTETNPKILELDFKKLDDHILIKQYRNTEGGELKNIYYCENIYENLANTIND
ncbi:hypothetical protein D770_01875 [Flammeovirgaceae bacterium 311]|nr:hypothetical protein D770_01875 [Flammeovirgaceae bacterium 311]